MQIKQHLSDRHNYGSWRSYWDILYLVFHYTANDGDTDEANANYFANNKLWASAHWFVDDDSATLSVPENYAAWSVGGGRQGSGGGSFFGICTNSNSISIELCDTCRNGVYDFTPATLKNAIELGRKIMKQYNIPIDRVIRHYDVTGKICPAPFVKDERAWQEFKNRLVNDSGWVNGDFGWWYRNEDGSYPTNQWVYIDAWYYFDNSGYAVTGWNRIKDHWYYFDGNCRMLTGWIWDGSHWFYANSDGSMYIGWLCLDHTWYFLRDYAHTDAYNPYGSLVTGWMSKDNYWFWMNSKGEMATGWTYIHGLWYLFDNNGYMQTGVYREGRFEYFLDDKGIMRTGWVWEDFENAIKWKFYNRDLNCQPVGSRMFGHWIKDKGKDYYICDDGYMADDCTMEIEGHMCKFAPSGELISGFEK